VAYCKSESEFIVGALQRVEQQIPNLRCLALELQAVANSGYFAFAVHTTEGTRLALDTLAATTQELRGRVVPADGLGDTLESLGELVIRAERMVMAEQVRQLHLAVLAIHSLTAWGQACAPLVLRSYEVSAAASLILDRLQRIDDLWMPYRSTGPAAAVSGNRVLYRTAICAAQIAVREMGTDPELGHVLREGALRMEWPAVRRAFASILAVVTLNICIEPDRQLFVHPVPLHSLRWTQGV
jgi:hypothetical protein